MATYSRGALKVIVCGFTWSWQFFVCASGGPHQGASFLLFFYCTCTCSCYTFVACALVFITPLLCICSYCASIAHTPVLATFKLRTCFCCSWITRAFAFVVPLLHAHLFLLCFSSCFDSLELSHSLWPSYIATMHYSSIHDLRVITLCCFIVLNLLALLHYVVSQFLAFLCYTLLFSS